ncbi:hypothetical protein N7516_003595 [Penicillium verrucosum]|uniref:uncharacterized protein n=1 Tax=Penicillium verrucosum TaxID=60171 RepID=UPI0025454FD0|nr:uncharacterized protein N7516_003595 [Penicillium verrucosum]KAJ5943427.1 hypothetical protein N7516_003595 [Penicillium verrucosum]
MDLLSARPGRPAPYSVLNVGFHRSLVRCWREATAKTIEVGGMVPRPWTSKSEQPGDSPRFGQMSSSYTQDCRSSCRESMLTLENRL